MTIQHARSFSRRRFLGGLTLAGTAEFLGVPPRPVAAEPLPETTTLRLIKLSGICIAPQYVAEDLLRAEGFTEVHYVERDDTQQALASGEVDISLGFVVLFITHLETGAPLVLLGAGRLRAPRV